jgi:putative addiction module component (TIGR02574 family)
MNARTKALSEQARRLNAEEKIELVEDLLQSLDPTDAEIDEAWAEEARDRLTAYLSGEMKANTLPSIFQKYQR